MEKDKADRQKDTKKATPEESAFSKLLAAQPKVVDKNQTRVDVLVRMAAIDSLLQEMLVKKLAPSIEEDDDSLLSEGKPLGSFMLRAKLAQRLGLISNDMYYFLKKLSRIRNICAHSEERIDVFGNQQVKQLVNDLDLRVNDEFKDKDTKVEGKFQNIASLVTITLRLELNSSKPFGSKEKEVMFD